MFRRPYRYRMGRFYRPSAGRSRFRNPRRFYDYWRDSIVDSSKEQITRVVHVDNNLFLNSLYHNTKEFDSRYFAVRRGQPFDIIVHLSQEYNAGRDDLRMVFQFGKEPKISKGTDVELHLSDKKEYKGWNAMIENVFDTTLKVKVSTPPDCYVGKWTLKIDTVKKNGDSTDVHRYNHGEKIYILFNPWCEDDTVYMADEFERKEYILNESGRIFYGNDKFIRWRPWVFGQFDSIVLDCALFLLEERSEMRDWARGNPTNVCRQISALVNAADEGGILYGNWSGDYSGGTSPLDWSGSVPILEEYYKHKEPVKFGQCWVFSAIVTTICRALGIPTRSVTNFSSAHDTDGSTTIDTYFDVNGDVDENMSGDEIWNFHVWNDVWMKRPDLPDGYDGWQAIDATPQEASNGIFCMGPMSLKAIKEGQISLPYDGAFVFAEVNGDKVRWFRMEDGTYFKLVDEDLIGKNISTKSVKDGSREDITHLYKYPEGDELNLAAVKRAKSLVKSHDKKADETYKDVHFEFLVPKKPYVGETVSVTLEMRNDSSEKRKLRGNLHIASQFYTGMLKDTIESQPIDIELKPNQGFPVEVIVSADTYFKHLTDFCGIKCYCFVNVRETGQTFAKEENLLLEKPPLKIKAKKNCKVGEQVTVEMSFENPLDMTLTGCKLWIEGPGLQRHLILKQKNVKAKGTFIGRVDITPAKPGKRELAVIFNSDQLYAIAESHMITVEEE